MDNNAISIVPDNSFRHLQHLQQLRLDSNNLHEIPVTAINMARALTALWV